MPNQYNSEDRTEEYIRDALRIQRWPLARPPKGRVVRKNEYQAYPGLATIFKGKSKSGPGDAFPDFLAVTEVDPRPQIAIEAKANNQSFKKAVSEAQEMAEACLAAGHPTLAVGVAGQPDDLVLVGVFKYQFGLWHPVTHSGTSISWIPTPADTERLLAASGLLDLAPQVPSPEVLAEKADYINRILREASVKDEYRPAYVGAMILALWQAKGAIRRDPAFVLGDINSACKQSFTQAGKLDLADSLYVDEDNGVLRSSAWRILAELGKLNVATAVFAHDYLGQLYETFFRYTGGNTIGQYFTPRHTTRLMADMCEVAANDQVIDPACGTGGFLIASLQRVVETSQMKYEDAVSLVRDRLIGYESEPVTAALCVANMILRGDGKTGVRKDNSFTAKDYPASQCHVALMNPPFPHKKTDVPPERFVDRALEALVPRGKLAVILPTSLLVKKAKEAWRRRILKSHSLLAVSQLPDELFQPYASSTTSIVLLEKGTPQDQKRETVFVRMKHDGLTLKKGVRVPRPDGLDQSQAVLDAVLNHRTIPGFAGMASVTPGDEWSPGAYVPSAVATEGEIRSSVDELLRRWASFYVRYAEEIARMRRALADRSLTALPYRNMIGAARLKNSKAIPAGAGTVGGVFDIYYGQKELHSRDGIPTGISLIISPTEEYNGCYGWLDFPNVIEPPFVTVAQTGTIGEAFVQTETCGVNDDCLVLLPKSKDITLARFALAAASIRLERWRFTYGRKLTPGRIAEFAMPDFPGLEAWTSERIDGWIGIAEAAVARYATLS